MTQVNIEEMIEKIRRIQLRWIRIVVINPKDSRLINLDELPGNAYVIEDSCIKSGKAVILGDNLKESAWERICNGRIKYKRGKKS